MTAVDGDPLTGDPTDAVIRRLLVTIKDRQTQAKAAQMPPRPVPTIHEPCGLTQCGGCTARACVSRRPGPVPVELVRRTPWYDTDTIDGANC